MTSELHSVKEKETKESRPSVYVGEEREVEVERKVYTILKDFNPAMYSYGCPIGYPVCGQLSEISNEFSRKNMFVAIPYSRYYHEKNIREVVVETGMIPKMAKDMIQSKPLLCKVCKEMRKCAYGIVDISKGNLNVIYELGLMQSLGMRCAILFAVGSSRPNDLQGIENVMYNNSKELKLDLARWIQGNTVEFDEAKLRLYIQKLSV